jgi:hypothetical protein
MTDITELRDRWKYRDEPHPADFVDLVEACVQIHDLCDALDEALEAKERYGLYNDEFVAARAALVARAEKAEAERDKWQSHDCEMCPDCLHDGAVVGRGCCGCYDGVCCKAPLREAPMTDIDTAELRERGPYITSMASDGYPVICVNTDSWNALCDALDEARERLVDSEVVSQRRSRELKEFAVRAWEAEAELAELRWAEMLTGQECENGKHADWFVDSEHNHLCPWCRIQKAEAQAIDNARHAERSAASEVRLGLLAEVEAERDALREELRIEEETNHACEMQALRGRESAEARLAAVRALCEPYGDPPIDATPSVDAILRALDGPAEEASDDDR